jgi:hypothetical protein
MQAPLEPVNWPKTTGIVQTESLATPLEFELHGHEKDDECDCN